MIWPGFTGRVWIWAIFAEYVSFYSAGGYKGAGGERSFLAGNSSAGDEEKPGFGLSLIF